MSRYRIEIDRERCVGDGLCRETAPDTFTIDPDGKSVVIDPGGDTPQLVKSAAKRCRLEAITLFDAHSGERVWPRL